MTKNVCVFLADGFEEIEALTVVDVLRRAGTQVTTVSITGELVVHGAHGIDVLADRLFDDMKYAGQDMLVLPGGMPGTKNLAAHEGLENVLAESCREEKYIAAICAAPSVLGKYGMLKGRKATSYPGFEDALEGAEILSEPVVQDGFVITSRGMGTALPFALHLVSVLFNPQKADEIGASIIYE